MDIDATKRALFRSDTHFEVLRATFTEPGREFALPELVELLDIPQPTLHREVMVLVTQGTLLSELRQGRRYVQANGESPVFDELVSLMGKLS